MKPPHVLTEFARRCGLDRAVTFTLLARVWGGATSIVNLALLIRFLSLSEQGFYYTFSRVLGLQVFFELGLSFVLLQFASHERARLEWTSRGTLDGDPVAKARLSSLLRRSLLWYGVIAGLVLLFILPAGLLFFHTYERPHTHVAWQGPYLWVTLCLMASLATTPLWATLEGCGLIAEIVTVQFAGGVLGSVVFWLLLFFHGKLYAAPAGSTVTLLCLLLWLWARKRRFFVDLLAAARPDIGISWRHELWPFQWKIGLSWLSGYFIFSLFVPLMFAFRGEIAAGQLGLSLGVASAISAIAVAWVTTKSAPFGNLVALREWARMDRLFFPCLWQSTAVLVFGNIAFWVGTLYLYHIGHRLSHRLLPPLPLGLLLLTTPLSHVASAQAIYLRAHKQEPFLVQSLVAAGLTVLLCFALGRPFGAVGMMAGYLIVGVVAGLGMGTWLFMRKRREWHTDLPKSEPPPMSREPSLRC